MCKHPSHEEYVTTDNEGRQTFRCNACGKPTRTYDAWWQRLWVTVRQNDLIDESFKPARYMGSVGQLTKYDRRTITFTVMPLNVLIDLVILLGRWFKYRTPGSAQKAMDGAYGRGRVDAQREAKADAYKHYEEQLKSQDREIKRLEAELFKHLHPEVTSDGVAL